MSMQPFEWANADSVEAAQALLDRGSVIKAGGVDLLDLMKERLAAPKRLVNIRNVAALDFIKPDDKGALSVGPLVTLAKLSDEPIVRKYFPVLADACGHAATPQVRNMATVGGNLLQRPRCWYFRHEDFHCRKKGGEKCFAQEGENQYHAIFNNGLCAIVHPSAAACALVALGASIDLVSGKDKRTVELEKFFVLPSEDLHRENNIERDEILTAIHVPALPANTSSAYTKQGEKESFDWPIAEVAAVIELDGPGGSVKSASIVLGAAAPVPHRAAEAEAALKGKKVTPEIAKDAARAALAAATPLANNGYKIPVFQAVIERTILRAAGVA